jgi:predicted nicotinamide N-methyase
MQNKRPHPALHISKAQKRSVSIGGTELPVWMAPDIDALLNDFITSSQTEGEDLGEQRCPFGAVLWPSARALWQWLQEDANRWTLVARSPDDATVNAIELGSGVGFFAALMSARTRWSITASDYEPAYEDYLDANCKLHTARKVPFLTLDWCEPTPRNLRNSFDLVLACDVFYDDSHLDNLPRIASELLKPNGTLLLADPERFRFRSAVEKLHQYFQKVEIHPTRIDNSTDDSEKSGVVNPNIKQTDVQIVHCQNPLTRDNR